MSGYPVLSIHQRTRAMRDTYSKLNYHLVFSTKNRIPRITDALRDPLYGYMGGILRGNGGVLLTAGGMPDHVHLLAGWGTSISVAKMLQLIKADSSKWMNKRPDATGGFAWQPGYGAFSVSASKIADVREYILNQEQHHRKLSFREELKGLLKRHAVDYDPDDFES
jgi:REP element-mobilizing transposase RayT